MAIDLSTLGAMHAWFDASAITGLADGAIVTNWPDVSGNGYHATTLWPTAANYETAELNSLPIVRMNGTRGLGTSFTTGPGGDEITVLAVVKAASLLAYQSLVRFQGNIISPYWSYPWGASALLINSADWGTTGPSTGLVAGAWNIGAAVHRRNKSPAGCVTYRNGEMVATKVSANVALPSGVKLDIGGRANTGEYTTGDVAEIVIYSVALSDSDRQKAEGQLAHKWGLASTLPANHPYRTEEPTASGGGSSRRILSSPHLIGSL